MTMSAKPGNHPDPNDMAAEFGHDGEPNSAASTHPKLTEDEAEEEEAARLGDFA
ncbi:MAG: hypothetical protein JWP15_739 [Alphaproteobacteria bacterium]|nr:hypothetical protein [Alphaproteobacteria bacterium]